MSSSGYINVFQWNRERFFSRRVKFDSGFNVMAVYMKFPDMDQQSFIASPASRSESWGGGRDPSDSPRKFMWLSPRIGRSRTKADAPSSRSLPQSVIRPSAAGKIKFPLSLGNIASFLHWVSFLSWFPMRPIVSNSSRPATSTSPFQIPPAYNAFPRNNPGNIFFPNWWILDWSLRSYGVILNQLTKWNYRSFKWLPKTSFKGRLPIKIIDLWRFADRCDIPWNLPTIFHPDLIATVPQTYLPSLCALLFQQSHSFPICVVSTYNDSRENLQRLCQILRNCQCKWLLGFPCRQGPSAGSIVFPEKFLFLHGYDWIHWVAKSCTTTAYRWLFRDSHPSLRTLWSAVIKSPKYSALGTTVPARLLQEPLVIFVLKQMSQFRSFGKWVQILCLLGRYYFCSRLQW